MEILKYVLIVLEVIASVALVAAVLLQPNKESGLGATFSGKTDTYMGKNGSGSLEQIAAKYTKWIVAAWIVLALVLNLF